MKIIPTVNCENFNCVKRKLAKVASFSEWVQIDIADGKFTKHKTWNNPEELKLLIAANHELNIEVHLMVEDPLEVVDDWIKAGVRRVIIHVEAIKDLRFKIEDLRKNCEIGLALNPDTPVKNLENFLQPITNNQQPIINFIQFLAVPPGKSGQKFDKRVLEKIKFLKKNYPNVIIEVDGGINLETAKMSKEAGANILVVGSYVWESVNPKKALKELEKILFSLKT